VTSSERFEIQLCGGLRVRRGAETVDLSKTARQGRLAFAYLVLHRDRAITREALMDRVWIDPDPQRVGASLSQTLSRLRNALGRENLERLPGGAVRLRGEFRVDVETAEAELREGRQACESGAWAASRAASDRVLADLAGEVLAGDEAEWLEPVRRSVAELRVEALELRATAALHMGATSDAELAARSAAEAAGTRESACALVMRAQAAQGDVARATTTFHAFQANLREYGLTPSRQLIDLHRRLVDGEPAHMTGTAAAAGQEQPLAFPPALSIESGEDAFVGREHVLSRLRERYAQAEAGTRQFVLLAGEPGIGKTRLASEFAREAHAGGASVLYGRSDAESLVPYQPFTTAIEHYIAHRGHREFARELDLELRELSRLIPDLRGSLPAPPEPVPVEPEMKQFRLFEAVSRVLASIARDRPTVLILDDMHWADTSTALLVRHIMQQIAGVRLLIIGTFRDDEACRSDNLAELLARMQPKPAFEQLALEGLDRAETAAFINARQGWDASDGFIRQLRYATDGNPLFIEETLKSLAEGGLTDDGEGVSEQALSPIEVPERVNGVIARRLLRLSATTRRLLAVASVLGAEFQLGLLARLCERSEDEVIAELEEATAAGLVRESEQVFRYAFSHALVREVLREQQSESRRVRLHHKIGEALEARDDSANPAELAHHFFESRDVDRGAKAFRYAIEAGDRAAQSLAHEEAATQFRRALVVLEMQATAAEQSRCDVLLALGQVELRQGDAAARNSFEQAAALARRAGLPERLGRAALGFASRYTEAGVVDEPGIALLREALGRLGPEASALRAELMARLADNLHFAAGRDEIAVLSDAALVMARQVGDTHALVVALESRHAALLHIEHLDERLRLSQELLELADRVGERELKALGHHWRIYDLLEAGDVESAKHEHRALLVLADELRQPLYQHFAVGWEVVWALMGGEVSRVERLAQESYELGLRAQARDAETVYRGQMIALRRRELRLPEFISTVQSAVEQHPAITAWRAVLPLARLAAGKRDEAIEEFEQLASDDFGGVRRDMFWFTSVCVLAETCALICDSARAAVLYRMLLPYRDRDVQVTQAVCWGSSERFLGLLATAMSQWERATEHFESAITKNRSRSNPAAASMVQRDYAEMLAARGLPGDVGRALALYGESLRAAEEAEMSGLSGLIRARMQAIEQHAAAASR
jgi:DNA-binding SARP family transcriptional activator/tetratricopeptide (TPR) repeat protein